MKQAHGEQGSGRRKRPSPRRCAPCAATLATVVALLAPGAAPAGPPGQPDRRPLTTPLPDRGLPGVVAVQANGIPGDLRTAEGVARRSAAYERLAAAGVQVVRMDIAWHQVEPRGAQGRMEFAERDAEVDLARAAGLEVLGILAYGHPDYSTAGAAVAPTPAAGGLPPFGLGGAHLWPPDDPADFAAYAGKTVAHFRDRVSRWEIWNEQNQGYRFWPPHEDPAAYTRLLRLASAAVREADPQATVIYGGLFFAAVPPGLPGQSAPDFLQASFEADPGLADRVDAFAYHPYPYPFTAPDLEVPVRGSVYSAADAMGAVLQRHGAAGRPLWITEVGWHSAGGYGVGPGKQAQYLVRTYLRSFAQGIPLVTWYTYGDEPDPSGYNQEAHFGLVGADGSPKPAYGALRTMTSTLRGTRFSADLSRKLGLPEGEAMSGGSAWALRFRSARRSPRGRRRTVTVLWHAPESALSDQGELPAAGGELEVSLPVRRRSLRVVAMDGSVSRRTTEGGVLKLAVGPSPVYVVEGFGG